MSALLRALMSQQVGGDDKPNLAVITDSGVLPIEALSGRINVKMNITAKLEKGKNYRVRFKWLLDVQEISDGSHNFGFGNYNFWRNINKFVKFYANNVQAYSGEADEIAECYLTDNATKTFVIQADAEHIKGLVRVYDVIIQEV